MVASLSFSFSLHFLRAVIGDFFICDIERSGCSEICALFQKPLFSCPARA